MIICGYCQAQLPAHSRFCCRCGSKVLLPGEPLAHPGSEPSGRQEEQATAQQVKCYLWNPTRPAQEHEHDQHHMRPKITFTLPILAENNFHIIWEADTDEDDTWL